MPTFAQFTPAQDRVCVNLADRYTHWVDLQRSASNTGYRLMWRTVNGARYLYAMWGRDPNGRSLGRETPALAERFSRWEEGRADFKLRMENLNAVIAETARIYRVLTLPMVDSYAAEIFREADVLGMLGTQLLVIGTNAMHAYEMEARALIFTGYDSTEDCDLAFAGNVVTFTVAGGAREQRTLFSLLKKIDPRYTVNTERTFQARNAKQNEVELLAAPSVLGRLPANELAPIGGMIAQEWLLYGQPVNHVVCGVDRKPTRIICPDPRWMALHKTWLSQQAVRSVTKRPKDAAQGRLLFAAIKTLMPHYPMDAAFEAALPDILKPVFAGLVAAFDQERRASPAIAPPRRSR